MATTSRKKAASGKDPAKASQEKRSRKNTAPVPEKEDFIGAEIIILLSFALAVLLFLSNFHLCGAAGGFLRNLQLGIFGMVGFIAPLLLFVGICFYLSNRGNPVAMRKLAACIGVVLSLCGFAQMLFGRQPDSGTGIWEYFRLSAESGLGGGLTGGLICAALSSVLGGIGAFLILLVSFLICVVCITERSIVKAVKRHGDAAYQMAKEDMGRRRELHAERQEERRRMREEKIRGVNLGSTDLFQTQNPEWEDEAKQYEEPEQQRGEPRQQYGEPVTYDESGYDDFGEEEAAGDRNFAGQTMPLKSRPPASQKTVQPMPQEPVRSLSRADVFTGKITMPGSYADTDEDTAPFEEDEVLSPAESAQRLVAEGISSIDDFEGMFGKPATVPSFPSTAAEPSFQGLDEEKLEEPIIPFKKPHTDRASDSEFESGEASQNEPVVKYGRNLRASYDEEQEGEIYLEAPEEETLSFESSDRGKNWGQEWYDGEDGLAEEGSGNGENSYYGEGSYRGESSYHDEDSSNGENNYHDENSYRGESSYHDEDSSNGENSYYDEDSSNGENSYYDESSYRDENSYYDESSYRDENSYHDESSYIDEGSNHKASSYYHGDSYSYEGGRDEEGNNRPGSRYDEEGFTDEYRVPRGTRQIITAAGKIIESDAEALQKKLETKRQEARDGQMGDEAAFRVQIKEKEKQPKKEYRFPPTSLMKPVSRVAGTSEQEYREIAIKLQQTLRDFGVGVTVTNISCGPSVTRYELHPDQGVKVSKIVGLTDDIKLSLAAADIRIEAPIPGKSAVGIEVPNKENTTVYLRELLESDAFRHHPSKLAFAVGKDIGGQVVVADIAKMPHLLIAGATGSGKSVCINTLIMSIIFKANPEEVKLIMVDPKVVELSVYNGIPHLLIPVVTDPKKASGALNWAVAEMDDRYKKFARYNVRNLAGYNAKVESIQDIEDEDKPQKLPQIVIIVDELADLMMVAPGEVEEAICRLAQLARAAGIHLVIATQRPSVNVITGLIKANVPSRIAFAVSSGVDSRTIIDMYGAEKLLGKGDMLFFPSGIPKPQRVQGAFVSDTEVQQIVEFLTEQGMGTEYNWEVEKQMSSVPSAGSGGSSNGRDEYFVQAGRSIIEKEKASIGMLQRMFKIGFNRAARIMDQLAEAGVVGEEEGTKPRKVLMTMKEFEEMMENGG